MCQYSANDVLANDWYVQHLGARVAGAAGIVMTQATSVSAVGRITPHHLGLYAQALLARPTAVISWSGTVPAIQLAHAGGAAKALGRRRCRRNMCVPRCRARSAGSRREAGPG